MRTTGLGLVVGLLVLVAATGCCCPQPSSGCAAVDDEADDGEEAIALSAVPANVMEAARAAVPGIVFEEAEREVENGVLIYALEGEVGGKEYEVEVSADGTVLEVEQDDDEDDDD